MIIKSYRYTKDGLTTVLEFGTGGGKYFVTIDGVVLEQTHNQLAACAKLREAIATLDGSSWTLEATPVFAGR